MLPSGATPVDFAYLVHTDVGHQCVGARVNGKMVPLRTRLQHGDIVEIVTAPGHRPSRDWLSFVGTSRARSKIRHFIQAEEKRRSIEFGRRLFEKEARRFMVSYKNLTSPARLEEAATAYGLQKAEDLFAAIGYGKLAARNVIAKLVPEEDLKERKPDTPITAAVKKVIGTADPKVRVRGFDDLMVSRARCCNPIRGERIVGYVTRGKGVSVHSISCPNVVNLLYDPERRIDVEWDRSTDSTSYPVRLALQVEDRRGILADVSAKIAGINTDIRTVEATTDETHGARINMTVEITDLRHLQRVMKSLRAINGVLDVERLGH
jgi:GTP pyrophosphokinase